MHRGYVDPLRPACTNRMIKVWMGKMRMCTIRNRITRGSTHRERKKNSKPRRERGVGRDRMRFQHIEIIQENHPKKGGGRENEIPTQKRKPCREREGKEKNRKESGERKWKHEKKYLIRLPPLLIVVQVLLP